MPDLIQNGLRKVKQMLRRLAHLVLPATVFVHIRRWRVGRQLMARAREDCRRYLAFSGTVLPYARKQSYQASLIKDYHVLEKALSFASPRPGFGQEVADQLVRELEGYLQKFGADELAKVVLNVLTAYCDFNVRHGVEKGELLARLSRLKQQVSDSGGAVSVSAGATRPVGRADIQRAGRAVFGEFVQQRYSIRNFANKPVPSELIKKAVQISLKTPSACNRQPWKVHCYIGREECGRVLQHQSGNRGFGDSVTCVLIVTCDLSGFFGTAELNAAYVDGGMFGMSLLYAIHSLGLGACCLNLSLQQENERAMRRAAAVPENQVLVLMIAVGQLPESLLVAQSSRKPLDEILIVHGSTAP